ncbi:MAG: hypothetical protein AB7H90_17690 [Alphaproteobacteria bacterium]
MRRGASDRNKAGDPTRLFDKNRFAAMRPGSMPVDVVRAMSRGAESAPSLSLAEQFA